MINSNEILMGKLDKHSSLRTGIRRLALFLFVLGFFAVSARAEEGDDSESKALDSTATQWSFQLAYQFMPSYYQDIIKGTAQPRPVGTDNYLQLRVVAPIPLKGVTFLPRLTVRHYENAQGEYGFGNTELFVLIIPSAFDWGSGRTGIGPLVTFPGDPTVSRNEWGFGFAAAVVNNSGKWFYGLLITQTWRGINPTALPPGNTSINPLGLAPFLNYRIGAGWYIGNGDMVILLDWNSGKWYVPFGVRVGKVFILKNGSTLNAYAEYQTSLIYKSYPGPAVQNSIRLNLSYAIPVNL